MARTASALPPLVQQFADALTAIRDARAPVTVAGITMFPPESPHSVRAKARFPMMFHSGLSFCDHDGDAIYSTCLEGRGFSSVACNRSRSGILAEARRLASEVEERERTLTRCIAWLKPIWDREYPEPVLALAA